MRKNDGVRREDGSAGSGTELARRLGLFDATMLVMGGIVATGIFVVPQLVAQQVHTPVLIFGVWLLGGLVALCGSLIYAELSARYPEVGGQYAYLREAYHPIVAFLFGWSLFLVIEAGAIASVATIFGRYFINVTGASFGEAALSGIAIAVLTIVNCFGVRGGSMLQNVLMVSKILVISLLIGGGLILNPTRPLNWMPIFGSTISGHLLKAGAAAMVPVLFTYSGWPSAGFVSGEVRDPRRNMPLATVLGVAGVVVLYCLVTLVDVRVLGTAQLSKTSAPASAVMRVVLGEKGAAMIAVGIMISALGYISQATLTAPRVYYAMAQDGLFFKSLVWLPRKTRVPVLAILLQGVCSIVIAFSGRYDQILNYVMSVEFVFLFLTGVSLFIFRRRTAMAARAGVIGPTRAAAYEMPGHPLTTLFFMTVCGLSVLNMFYTNLINSLIGWGIVLVGIPVYFSWQWRNSRVQETALRKVTPST